MAADTLNQDQLVAILTFFKQRAQADDLDTLLEVDLSGAYSNRAPGTNVRNFSQQTADGLVKLLNQIEVEITPELTKTLNQWLRSNTLGMPKPGAPAESGTLRDWPDPPDDQEFAHERLRFSEGAWVEMSGTIGKRLFYTFLKVVNPRG